MTPNTQGASWEGKTQAFLEQFIATCKEKPCEGCLIDIVAVMNHIREIASKERAEGERCGAERCVVILEKYLNADEVVRNGQRFLVIDGADVPYGYPYPDNRLKYALRAITTLPADSTEEITNKDY